MDIDNMSLKNIWKEIDRTANENPELIKELNATYLFEMDGHEKGKYSLKFNDGVATVVKGDTCDADCSLLINVDNFKKLLQGNLNATTAYMTGRVKIKGNIGLALQLKKVLKKFSI